MNHERVLKQWVDRHAGSKELAPELPPPTTRQLAYAYLEYAATRHPKNIEKQEYVIVEGILGAHELRARALKDGAPTENLDEAIAVLNARGKMR